MQSLFPFKAAMEVWWAKVCATCRRLSFAGGHNKIKYVYEAAVNHV